MIDTVLDYVMYGHIGNGNIHTRPLIDAQSTKAVEIIEHLAQDVFSKVRESEEVLAPSMGTGWRVLATLNRCLAQMYTGSLFR